MSVVTMLCLMAGSIGAVAAQDDKPTVTIGGVGYTELNIQIEMMALMLEDAGHEVAGDVARAFLGEHGTIGGDD